MGTHKHTRTPQPKSVEPFPAPLFRFLHLLVFLPRHLHRLHPRCDLIRTQGPSVVTDPKLMWEHLHPRKRRTVLISPALDERSRVSTERVRFKELVVQGIHSPGTLRVGGDYWIWRSRPVLNGRGGGI